MTRLTILGAGAVTPVGLTHAQTCTAIRAGIAAFAESDFFLWRTEREPVVVAAVPLKARPIVSKPVGRLSALARNAIAECLLQSSMQPSETALFLGVPESERADRFRDWFDEDLYEGLRVRVLRAFHSSSQILNIGKAAAFFGLLKAHDLLQRRVVNNCIVGGVDSLLNEPDLDKLEHTWRLHRNGESYGLIPGEAAGFIAVTRSENAHGRASIGRIKGLGFDQEPTETTVLSDGHPTGKGLERALESAINDAEISEAAVGLRISDLNGERYGAMDSMLAVSRFYRTDRNGLPLWHPAECIGETGAASGAILLQVACHALSRGYSPTDTIMCESSSDNGHRAACLISAAV